MRVLHGMSEAASQAAYAVSGLRMLGYEADTARWVESDKYAFPADYSIGVEKRKPWLYPRYLADMVKFARFAAGYYDVFHFHFGHSLLPGDLDLPQLKRQGKKCFFEYHGSDLRQGERWVRGNPYADEIPAYRKNAKIERAARKALHYADGVIVHDAEIATYLPDKPEVPVYYVPLRLDVASFEPEYPAAEVEGGYRPLIVHAPSNRAVKGSDHVEATIAELQKRFAFDFALVEGMSRKEALDVYRRADIVIDQIIIGSYGVFALECMSMGKPVVVYLRDDVRATYPSECPVVSSSKETLFEVLSTLLVDAHLRHDVGKKSRIFAETYHDYRYVAPLLAAVYEGVQEPNSPSEAYEAVKHAKLQACISGSGMS